MNPDSSRDAATGRHQVTIRDLAKHAGVSTGTISRVLKNEPGFTQFARNLAEVVQSYAV